ncbi:MAG: excinuclease ABC subunit UvrC [Desulfurispora sp.]|uniref:excinuclease ABC subunit UvrC n=1 Tax=Desulfurispora sp. TaxID=3014275 RepID=UPI00404A2F40
MSLQDKLPHLPAAPGVYIFRDSSGSVLYVGKAVSLRQRVRSYFQDPARLPPKTRVMLQKAADLEYIVTDNEVEALILEANLIKEHRPRYNVLLRDDKSYPYLKVTINEDYPRVFVTRTVTRDGARYFGPYTAVRDLRETLEVLRSLFPFRTCKHKDLSKVERPCLNYHIKRCPAPCGGRVSREEYRRSMEQICLFLEGRQEEILKQLRGQMQAAAAALQFEKAALLRDRLRALESVLEKQKVAAAGRGDRDVLALARSGDLSCVALFFVRGGKLVGRENFFLEGTEGLERAEVLTAFLKQYYSRAEFIPPLLLLSEGDRRELAAVAGWLTLLQKKSGPIDRAGVVGQPESKPPEGWPEELGREKKRPAVQIKVPQKGDDKQLVDMVAHNARLALQEEELARTGRQRKEQALERLAAVLGLPEPPHRLECYDISHTAGQEAVASLVVMLEGRPAPQEYRKFHLRTLSGPDDFAAMTEVLERRFNRAREERQLINTGQLSTKEAKFYQLPDLVLIDGGAGQLVAALRVLQQQGLAHIPVFALAKKEELIYRPAGQPLRLQRDDSALQLLQVLRDEAHRFAVSYHRQRRTRRSLKSVLEEIPGIGPVRRRALQKAFPGLEELKKASLEELAALPGMNRSAAAAVYRFWHGEGGDRE